MMSESFTVKHTLCFMIECIKQNNDPGQELLNLKMTLCDRWCLFALSHQGGGCGLMTRTRKFEQIVKGMNYVSVDLFEKYKMFFSVAVPWKNI